ncbi:MAG: hypothetical protein HC811_09665 [Flammeovirgaceae bacterium]|nr:hypothetical protein [Flammeovirgaceae bacterium]
MKVSRLISVALLLSAIVVFNSGCKEDDPVPLGAETNAKLLAGEPGQSKTWKLTLGTIQIDGGPIQAFGFSACTLDNLYKFTNNASQDYEATEGTAKCDPADPNLIERGNWAFTLDGEIVIVSSDEIFSGNGLFSYYWLPVPGKVTELTEDSFELELNINDQQTLLVKYTFEKQ